MNNLAGVDSVQADAECEAELKSAGIEMENFPECMRHRMGEVKTVVAGGLHGWSFTRAWYYWIAKGPGLPLEYAMRLYRDCGKEVRVAGHCAGVSPLWYSGLSVGSYHVDTLEGLSALSKAIRQAVNDAKERYPEEWEKLNKGK